jgi:hypothetical protein
MRCRRRQPPGKPGPGNKLTNYSATFTAAMP